MYPLMGNNIILARSDATWQAKRKALSVTFYKDKLMKYFEIMKKVQVKNL